MPVVRTIRVRVDWVQFPAPRPRNARTAACFILRQICCDFTPSGLANAAGCRGPQNCYTRRPR